MDTWQQARPLSKLPGLRAQPKAKSRRRLLCALVAGLVLSTAVRLVDASEWDDTAKIFLTASQQKEAIAKSLVEEGFVLTDRMSEADYLLRVTVGVRRGWKDCGTKNNVKFSLRRDKRTVVEVVVQGWTGSCEPSAFREASQQLRERLRSGGSE
jgi:hypothetical protein